MERDTARPTSLDQELMSRRRIRGGVPTSRGIQSMEKGEAEALVVCRLHCLARNCLLLDTIHGCLKAA
jgi:hypothetical protein